jgi:hypothetical protein
MICAGDSGSFGNWALDASLTAGRYFLREYPNKSPAPLPIQIHRFCARFPAVWQGCRQMVVSFQNLARYCGDDSRRWLGPVQNFKRLSQCHLALNFRPICLHFPDRYHFHGCLNALSFAFCQTIDRQPASLSCRQPQLEIAIMPRPDPRACAGYWADARRAPPGG